MEGSMYQLPSIRNMIKRFDKISTKMTTMEELEKRVKELKAQLDVADSLAERKQIRSELREVRQKLFEVPSPTTSVVSTDKKDNTKAVKKENEKNKKLIVDDNNNNQVAEATNRRSNRLNSRDNSINQQNSRATENRKEEETEPVIGRYSRSKESSTEIVDYRSKRTTSRNNSRESELGRKTSIRNSRSSSQETEHSEAKNPRNQIPSNKDSSPEKEEDMSITIRTSSSRFITDANNNSVETKENLKDIPSGNSGEARTKTAEDRAARRARRAEHMKSLGSVGPSKSVDKTETVVNGLENTTPEKQEERKNPEEMKKENKGEKSGSFSSVTVTANINHVEDKEIETSKPSKPEVIEPNKTEPKMDENVNKTDVITRKSNTPLTNNSSPSGLRRTATWSVKDRTNATRNIGNALNIKKFGAQGPTSSDRPSSTYNSNRLSTGSAIKTSVSPRSSPRMQRKVIEVAAPEKEAPPDLKRQSVNDRMAFFRQAQEQEKKDIEKKKVQEEQRKRLSSAAEGKKEEEPKKPEEEPEQKDNEKMKFAAPCMKKREKKKVVRRTMSIGSIVLDWVQEMIRDYPVEVKNFSSSWNNGMAFCALIHHFNPDEFDFSELKPENKRYNFDMAFNTGLKCKNIPILLDTEDMVRMARPEPRSVQTYIQWVWSVYGPTSGYGPTPKEVQTATLA